MGKRVPIWKRKLSLPSKTKDTPATPILPSITTACSSIVWKASLFSHPPVITDKAKSVVKLRANKSTNMASVIAARPPKFSAALAHVILARPVAVFAVAGASDATSSIAEIFAAESTTNTDMAILDRAPPTTYGIHTKPSSPTAGCTTYTSPSPTTPKCLSSIRESSPST